MHASCYSVHLTNPFQKHGLQIVEYKNNCQI